MCNLLCISRGTWYRNTCSNLEHLPDQYVSHLQVHGTPIPLNPPTHLHLLFLGFFKLHHVQQKSKSQNPGFRIGIRIFRKIDGKSIGITEHFRSQATPLFFNNPQFFSFAFIGLARCVNVVGNSTIATTARTDIDAHATTTSRLMDLDFLLLAKKRFHIWIDWCTIPGQVPGYSPP